MRADAARDAERDALLRALGAAEARLQARPLEDHTVGTLVEVYCSSQQKWFSDGVLTKARGVEGIAVDYDGGRSHEILPSFDLSKNLRLLGTAPQLPERDPTDPTELQSRLDALTR